MNRLLIVDAQGQAAADRARVGGKGWGLFALVRDGYRVPTPVVLDAAAMDPFVDEARALFEAAESGDEQAAAEIGRLLSARPLDVEVEEALRAALELPELRDVPLVVRSSAVDEDGAHASFAGLLRSVVNVRGQGAVEEAIRAVWASGFSPSMIAYRRKLGLLGRPMRVAVVVQPFVDGEVSGVTFSRDPDDPGRILTVAARGLCEGVVAGIADTDRYAYDIESGAWTSEVGAKSVWVERAAAGTEEVTRAAEVTPVLAHAQLEAMRDVARSLETRFGHPQDIEWTLRGDELWVLQSRPIRQTQKWKTAPPPASEAPRNASEALDFLYDNSNIVESYAGVTTPLTFTYARYAYGIAYRQSCELAGVPLSEIKANERTYNTMLASLDGRIYYNLGSWYRLLALFPGFEKNRGRMEEMMGVSEAARIDAARPRRTLGQRLFMLRRMVSNFFAIDGMVARFERSFAETYARARALEWETLPAPAVLDHLHALLDALLWNWQAPLLTDFLAMVFHGMLKDLVESWGLVDAGVLVGDLLAGEGGLESTEPTFELIRIARSLDSDPRAKALVLDGDDDALMEGVRRELPELHARLADWLERFGARSMQEQKLEVPTLEENPGFVFAMLRNYLRRADITVESFLAEEARRRTAAEEKAREALRGHPLRRAVLRWVLGHTRRHVKNRENMRFARTRSFGVLRRVFLRLGAIYEREGVLDAREDVFFLELSEVLGGIDGTAACADLKGLAAVRRAAFDAACLRPDPDERVAVRGGLAFAELRARSSASDEGGLSGVGCAPGTVHGVARVIRPGDALDLDGEILVAERTDPGWVPLFPSASGLLVERGSPLSHSAVVARELGLPTIVGIRGLTARVKSGDRLVMDAARGTVVNESERGTR